MHKKNKKEKKNSKKFNAYQYAQEFEKLSLEIVKIVHKEKFDENNIIYGNTTQQTRDYGVDAYLVINIQESLKTYTIESKLRTSDSLSLKDFATSILYYLINTSSKHFVVTNVSYSSETIKYIEQSNMKSEKFINLIDGRMLQDTINASLEYFYNFSQELVNYILSRNFEGIPALPLSYQSETKEPSYIELPYYGTLINNISTKLKTEYNFFIVTGRHGEGKTTFIDYCIDKVFLNYSIHKFDLSLIHTPRLLVLEILHLLLGFSIEKLIFEMDDNDNVINEIIEPLQVFHKNSKQIIDAIKQLLNFKNNDSQTYVYMMNILVEHLYNNFLLNTSTVLVIENLHEATEEMIEFTIKTMYCLGKKNIIVFWEILIPQNAGQLANVNLDQWYSFLQLLESKSLVKNSSPYLIKLSGLLENDVEIDVKYIIEKYITGISFTDKFIQTFIKCFGTNIRNIFNALKIIKAQQLYSASSIQNLNIDYSIIIETQISDLLDKKNNDYEFYQWVFSFVFLLDGKIDFSVLKFMDKTFNTNSKNTLKKSGLFYQKNNSLEFQYSNMNDIISQLLDTDIKENCAHWILNFLNELDINYVTKRYYEASLLHIVSPLDSIKNLNEDIKYLYNLKAYKYVLSLSEIRYIYYKRMENELLYYKYYIKYISYLRKSTSDLGLLNRKIREAEDLRERLAIKYLNNDEYIRINLELALIQYHISKSLYDYNDCENKINYILQYENILKESDIFINARIYYALIKKEQGYRKEFVLELINNYKRYQQNNDVKISYYINLAAMYKFSHIDIAIKLIQTVQKLTFDSQNGCADLEVELNLLHLLCYQKKSQNTLQHILFIRSVAEKKNSMYILAKTFNLEAYYYIKFNLNNIDSIIECLKSAVFHSLSNGQAKQSFLFGLNLANVLAASERKYIDEFNIVFQWFKKHQIIMERLKNNPYIYNDHMFAALISLICLSKKLKMPSLISNELADLFPKLTSMSEKELLAYVPDYYKIKLSKEIQTSQEIVFILF